MNYIKSIFNENFKQFILNIYNENFKYLLLFIGNKGIMIIDIYPLFLFSKKNKQFKIFK